MLYTDESFGDWLRPRGDSGGLVGDRLEDHGMRAPLALVELARPAGLVPPGQVRLMIM